MNCRVFVFLFAILLAVPTVATAASDAEILALEISGALLPPPDMVAAVTADLAAIRAADPYFTRFYASPDWVPGELIVGLTPAGWVACNGGTGCCLDDLNSSLGGTVADRQEWLRCFLLSYSEPYHPQRLAELYAPLDCVEYAEPDGVGFTGPYDISSTAVGTYTFFQGWDDCVAGCLHHHCWKFNVVVGIAHCDSSWGEPVPELADVPRPRLDAPLLFQNAPNPFNPSTTLRFDLPVGGRVRLAVYDVAGRLLRTLLDADLPAGSHSAVWDGRDSAGRSLASGSYFARLQVGGKVQVVRLSLIR